MKLLEDNIPFKLLLPLVANETYRKGFLSMVFKYISDKLILKLASIFGFPGEDENLLEVESSLVKYASEWPSRMVVENRTEWCNHVLTIDKKKNKITCTLGTEVIEAEFKDGLRFSY